MSRCSPLFGRVGVSIVTLTIGVYIVVAELAGFDLLVVRMPDYSVIAHRAREVVFLWMIVCLGYGWTLVLTGRMRFRTPNPVAVALVPVIIGLCLGFYNVWAYKVWPFERHLAPPAGKALWILLGIASATWIVGIGALAGYTLIIHGTIWRRYFSGRGCWKCEYDLTGNESGVCPECGEPIRNAAVHRVSKKNVGRQQMKAAD